MAVVVGDFGATNIRLAVLRSGQMSDIYRFACDDFQDAYAVLQSFVYGYVPDVSSVLLGVPGPVVNGSVSWTNRSWRLDEKKLKKMFNLQQVFLKNDLVVQGEALSCLSKKDFVVLQKGKARRGVKVLANVGTGLGVCFVCDGQVFPAEYGPTLLEDGMPLEKIVSATGFKALYADIKGEEGVSSSEIFKRFQAKETAALETYELFYLYLGRTLMNLALTFQAVGGVYFAGNMLDEHTLQYFKIIEKFLAHPTMRPILKEIPVVFVKRKDFAFLGFTKLVKKYGLS